MRDLGVYAFGARTKRVYSLRKRREVLESTPSWDSRYSSTEDARVRDERVWDYYAFGRHEFIHGGRERD
jgi:hypothetical protein